jgi:Ca2+-transporting ATPase
MVKVTGAGLEPEGDFVQDGEPVSVEGDDALRLALEIGTLCNNSRLSHHEMEAGDRWEIRGDPTEGALVVVAAKAGLRKETLDDRRERIDEIPFSSKSKFMATFHRVDGDEIDVYVKGAPETVVYLSTGVLWDGEAHDLTDDRRQAILDENEGMAANALRVLALAHQRISQSELEEVKDDLQHGRGRLTFVGLAGMIDPPRPEARPAVEQSQSAGIQVLMLTGDHRLTGGAIAREVGILDRDGDGQVITGAEIEDLTDDELDELMREAKAFARVSPEHKHRIVESLARNGHVAAMTGDGVNDAPALQASAIGVAMGITGTDVTKGTADMVLTDDNFASIVAAVEEGRAVFQNVRKVVKFLLATNAGEILTILAALILLPIEQTIFTPVQLLWVNLVTDGLLDVTIAMEPKEGDVMEDPPRKPDTPIVTRVMVQNMVFVAVFMAVGTLWSFVRLYPQAGLVYARTVTFVTLAMFQVFNSLNVRSRTKSVFELGFFTNPYLIAAIIVSVLLQVMATQVGFFQGILDTQPISLSDWGLIVLVSSSVFIAEEIRKRIAARRRR